MTEWMFEILGMLHKETGKQPSRILKSDMKSMLSNPMLHDNLTDIASWLLIRIGRRSRRWHENNF